MKRWKLTLGIGVAVLVLTGAGFWWHHTTLPDPSSLVTPLPKLTTAVVAEIRDPLSGKTVSDDQLVSEATRDNPELRRAFAKTRILIRHDLTNAVLLVCSPDGRHAWLEDASWTQFVDKKLFLTNSSGPPAFTISLP